MGVEISPELPPPPGPRVSKCHYKKLCMVIDPGLSTYTIILNYDIIGVNQMPKGGILARCMVSNEHPVLAPCWRQGTLVDRESSRPLTREPEYESRRNQA